MLDAYRFAAAATRKNLERASGPGARSTPAAWLYRGVLAQYNGDVDGAIRILRHLVRKLSGTDRAIAADFLAPILVMRHENAEVLTLADAIESGGWFAASEAFRAISAGDVGDKEGARKHFAAAEEALSEEQDLVVRSRVLQRLARTAYYLGDHVKAIDLALSSAKLCSQLGAWRAAAGCYSIIYNVHHNVTGDIEESYRYVRLWHDAALVTEDDSFVHGALVAEFEMAVQFADDQRVAELQSKIRSRLLPQQYTETFALSFAHGLLRGRVDLQEMCTLFQLLRDMPGRTRGQWALCTGLIAVGQAGLIDDAGARDSVRLASSRLGRPSASESAFETRARRIARAAIAAACVLIGDTVRGDRAISGHESRSGAGEDILPQLLRSQSLDKAPSSLRGIANVFEAARANRVRLEPPAGLTHAELEILRLLDRGWSARKIAQETGRSINTVYNHSRAILTKLDASRSPEAVAIARERGYL